MELSLFRHQHSHHTILHSSFIHSSRTKHKSLYSRNSFRLPCRCTYSSSGQSAAVPSTLSLQTEGRRALLTALLTTAAEVYSCGVAGAVCTSRRALRASKIPEGEFKTLPNGLKAVHYLPNNLDYPGLCISLKTVTSTPENRYYDLKVESGAEAVKGSRVAVHYIAKWKNITFMTSRQGMGVGGGTPYGFDVGQSENGTVLKGLDLGVQDMRVGGQRLFIVPPELAYGSKGVQEIPPNATIEIDIELLSIKQSPFGQDCGKDR